MHARIQKWGNSQGIRIPKSVLSSASFSEDEEVELHVSEGRIVIKAVKPHRTLKQRLKNYDGNFRCSEWDTGASSGKEEI